MYVKELKIVDRCVVATTDPSNKYSRKILILSMFMVTIRFLYCVRGGKNEYKAALLRIPLSQLAERNLLGIHSSWALVCSSILNIML